MKLLPPLSLFHTDIKMKRIAKNQFQITDATYKLITTGIRNGYINDSCYIKVILYSKVSIVPSQVFSGL